MADKQIAVLSVAAALAGAVAMAGVATPVDAQSKVKCYGISLAGENGCANAAGTHSCAGQSTVDYDMGEWQLASADECEAKNGSLEPGEGVNPAYAG